MDPTVGYLFIRWWLLSFNNALFFVCPSRFKNVTLGSFF